MDTLAVRRGIFLADEINYYSQDVNRRAVVFTQGYGGDYAQRCVYKAPNGNRCQIGRYIREDVNIASIEGNTVSSILVQHALPPEILELGVVFLGYCQNLHDTKDNWDKYRGLSIQGEMAVELMISIFSLVMPPVINGRYVIESRTNPPVYIEDFLQGCRELETVESRSYSFTPLKQQNNVNFKSNYIGVQLVQKNLY